MSTLKAKHFHLVDDMAVAAKILDIVETIEVFVAKVANLGQTWARRAAERRALAVLSDRLLDDIGLTRAEIDREVAKYFWQK